MALEFDHLFICTDIGACDADRLVAFGLVEGASNTHLGQGTANRRFFFHNAMLELLWVHDTEEAKSEPIRLTRLWERWTNRQDGACPFGVCLRPAIGLSDTTVSSSWTYRPMLCGRRAMLKVYCLVLAVGSSIYTHYQTRMHSRVCAFA